MKVEPHSRKDKIALLKDLQNGKITLQDLLPVQLRFWRVQDGIYKLLGSNLQLTKQEFFELETKQNKTINFCGGDIDDLISVVQAKDDAKQ